MTSAIMLYRGIAPALLIAALSLSQAAANGAEGHWLDDFNDDIEMYSIDGYRLLRYRSPTPATSEDAVTLSTAQLKQLLDSASPPALLDVQPLPWHNGFFVQKEARQHIPGSRWIPNVGLGELTTDQEQYFRDQLAISSNGNRDHPLVIYCRADCWMSWNAVKRASRWGFRQLYWYREGTDGWRDVGLKMNTATPVPLN